jgi:hypothetical protein
VAGGILERDESRRDQSTRPVTIKQASIVAWRIMSLATSEGLVDRLAMIGTVGWRQRGYTVLYDGMTSLSSAQLLPQATREPSQKCHHDHRVREFSFTFSLFFLYLYWWLVWYYCCSGLFIVCVGFDFDFDFDFGFGFGFLLYSLYRTNGHIFVESEQVACLPSQQRPTKAISFQAIRNLAAGLLTANYVDYVAREMLVFGWSPSARPSLPRHRQYGTYVPVR